MQIMHLLAYRCTGNVFYNNVNVKSQVVDATV